MKKAKSMVAYTQRLIGLNSIIRNCPGKDGLRLNPIRTEDNDILDIGVYDVFWDGKDLGIQAMMFKLNKDECPSDSVEDSYMIQFGVLVNKIVVFFSLRLSEKFTSDDLATIADAVREVALYVKEGTYSLDELMSLLYSQVFTDEELKDIRLTIALCSVVVERVIYPKSLDNYYELKESDKIKECLPNQLVYDYSKGKTDNDEGARPLDYTFVSLESGIYFTVSGETEELIDVDEMSNVEMYLAKLKSMQILLKDGKKGIIENLPTFRDFTQDAIQMVIKENN